MALDGFFDKIRDGIEDVLTLDVLTLAVADRKRLAVIRMSQNIVTCL